MYNYSYALVIALALFSGCGGGGSDTPIAPLNTEQNLLSVTAQNLRQAGFDEASDVVQLNQNTIAFTYFKNSNKHFVIYDNKKAKVISDIESFIGDTVSDSSANQITYTNGTTVDIKDYTKPSTYTTNTNTTTKSALDILKEIYGSNLKIFTYSSDNKSDAVVVVQDANYVNLYMYDTPNASTPRLLYSITPPTSGSRWTNVYNVRKIGNGQITFTGTSRGNNDYETKSYTYYYLERRYANTGSSSSSSQQSSSVVDQIKQANEFGEDRLISYTYSSGGNGILVIGENSGGTYFYKYNANPVYFEEAFYNTELTHEAEVYGATAVSGGEFNIQTNKGTYRFNYFTGELRRL